jgi:hypothetical protein
MSSLRILGSTGFARQELTQFIELIKAAQTIAQFHEWRGEATGFLKASCALGALTDDDMRSFKLAIDQATDGWNERSR